MTCEQFRCRRKSQRAQRRRGRGTQRRGGFDPALLRVQGADPQFAESRQPAALCSRSSETHCRHKGGAAGRHPACDHPAGPCVASGRRRANAQGLAQAVDRMENGTQQSYPQAHRTTRSTRRLHWMRLPVDYRLSLEEPLGSTCGTRCRPAIARSRSGLTRADIARSASTDDGNSCLRIAVGIAGRAPCLQQPRNSSAAVE